VNPGSADKFDAVIVGAGFAGMYMLYRLRELGLKCKVFEAGDDVGGTWYWNRYPGARCDAESLAYSYSFSPELEQEWQWSERYATQPEILRYAQHVAKRFALDRDIAFQTRIVSAHYDDDRSRWRIETDRGDVADARFCIMATGCLSRPLIPDIPGLDDFAGARYQASLWPHDGVDFSGLRVGVIGTGSSGIQAIPVIAAQAKHLTVFQRTPNFSVPAVNAPLDTNWVERFKRHYREHRNFHKLGLSSGFGDLEIEPVARAPVVESGADLSAAEVAAILEPRWQRGGAYFLGAIGDGMTNPVTNEKIAEFVRNKIRTTVRDPKTAELLCPRDHPIGTKRICVDTGYYETFNRDNVTLVDVRTSPIVRIHTGGLTTSDADYALDALVLATGFDAMTGALLNIDIRGRNGRSLDDKWQAGPRAYLGIGVEGFPNLFTITGPGSPSVLSNVLVSIEQHVDWVVDCIGYMADKGFITVEPDRAAETEWVEHVNQVANMTLFPRGGSWYLGANIPGKPRVFMPYAAGVGPYREICEQVQAEGYRGFGFA
jgi:cyclohexanone monooxygenase